MRLSPFIIALLLSCSANKCFSIEASAAVKVTPLLKTQTSWDGKAIEYPKGTAEITGMTVEIAPGGETGWHLHPVPSFGVVLEGELEVTLKSGEHKIIKHGEALAEVVNTLHNGRNIGRTPVKILVFYAGSSDTKITEKAPTDESPAVKSANNK
jgi:quercetin dioxygenase-like cupin family protein